MEHQIPPAKQTRVPLDTDKTFSTQNVSFSLLRDAVGRLIFYHSPFWSPLAMPPRAFAAPSPAPPISVTTLSGSSTFPGGQLRYAKSTIQNFERFKGVSPFIQLVDPGACIILIVMDFFTIEYKLASSYPSNLNSKKSSVQCWRLYFWFLSDHWEQQKVVQCWPLHLSCGRACQQMYPLPKVSTLFFIAVDPAMYCI